MSSLRITSCQAPNSEYIGRTLADYLRANLDVRVEWVDDIPWPERYAQLEQGSIHVAWICGAPYVRLRERGVDVGLLAAPVWRAPRYGDAPVYFSDVVVRRESPFQTFDDLRGARWAYNEPGSFSGYECVRAELARLAAPQPYFGAVVRAGSHENALRLILEQAVDGAAIDSTVLEEEVRARPRLAEEIRIVHTIGPAPMPPWVAGPGVPLELRDRLRHLLATMDQSPEGRRQLANTPLARLHAVEDADYDATRALLARGAHVTLGPDA